MPKPVLAWPQLERLVHKRDRRRVDALRRWRDLTATLRPASTWTDDPDIGENPGDPELYREVRPSVTEALAAIGWRVVGKERWHHTGQRVHTFARPDTPATEQHAVRDGHHETRLEDLLFRNGKLVEYGRTAKERPKLPADRLRGEKGGKTAPRNPQRYLSLPAAVPSPLHAEGYRRPLSGQPALPDFYDPLPGVTAARALLRSLGVDGSVPLDRLPVPATRCPDYVLPGAQWKGGIVRGKGTGQGQAWDGASAMRCTAGDIGQARAEDEMARAADERRFRKALGQDAEILDMAVTDATAEEIGIAHGYAPTSAKKYGAALIDKALDRLIDALCVADEIRSAIAANDNCPNHEKIAA